IPLQDGDVLLVPEQRNQVTLVGEFVRPGPYPFVEGDMLSSVGALGGGTTREADLRNATLTRDGKTRRLDLYAMLKEGDFSADAPLKDGDLISVPAARREVTLVGQFSEPGTYPFEEGNSISQALALGKGTTPDADLRRAVLKRGAQQIPVDLKALVERGDLSQDLPLQHGDVLIVPKGIKIMTQGALQKPGVVTVSEGMDVVDVLIASGNKTDKARLDRAVVVRIVDGKPKEIPLDLKDAVEKGGPARQFAFQDGDVLYVPEKKPPIPWQAALNAMYLLALSAAQWR
ncbi:MAG: SLBB domain-containing protein, partial [Armatimonadota bacterium]|nr:SLBB domain-containing protein [Armatimonadota bacterium]